MSRMVGDVEEAVAVPLAGGEEGTSAAVVEI